MEKQQRYLYKIAVVATLGGLLFGFDSSVTNGSLIFMARPDQLNLSALGEGLVTSALLFGAAFGSIAGGRISDNYGRKKCIVMMAAIFFLARFGCVFAPSAEVMIASRFVIGLAVGGVSVTVPTYLAEIAPAKQRGRFVAQNCLMIVVGQFLAFVINALLGNLLAVPEVWRYIIAVAFCPAAFLWAGMVYLPESPRWLIAKGRMDEAMRVLQKIRRPELAEIEFHEIKKLVISEANIRQAQLKEFIEVPWIKRLLCIGVGIAIIQQITGVNAINYYGTKILHDSGFSLEAALIANIANGFISVTATVIGMYYLEKQGRRKLFIWGLMLTILPLCAISALSLTLDSHPYYGYFILAMTMTFMAFQQGCCGLVTWILMSELFPLRLRGLGMGFIAFVSWVGNFMVGLCFPMLISVLGTSATFLVFAFFGVISLMLVIKYCPETKGRTLEQLEYCFRNYKTIDCRKPSLQRGVESNETVH